MPESALRAMLTARILRGHLDPPDGWTYERRVYEALCLRQRIDRACEGRTDCERREILETLAGELIA